MSKNLISRINVVNLSEAFKLFNKLRNNGTTFRVDFVKKSDHSIRTMICRMKVTKYLSGGKRNGGADLITVYEWGKGYRSFSMDNILAIKQGNTLYSFGVINKNDSRAYVSTEGYGAYNTTKPVKLPAITSVLFK